MSARSATPASSTAPTRRHWFTQPAVLAAVVGGALTALAWLSVVYYWNPQIATDELNALGDNRRVVLQSALDDIDQTVQTVAAYFNTSDDEVERNEFDSFLERLPESSAVLGRIVWAPRVPHDRRAQFEAEAAREGRRDYHIREVKPNGALVPAADAEEYFPILFSTGAVALSPAVEGIDLGSQPGLPPAMARARDADRPVASQLFPLQTDYGPFMGITLLTPVYQFGKPHLTLDERRRNLAGYVAAVFAPGMVLDRSLRSIPSPRGLDIYFFPENAGPGDPPFHVRSSLLRKTPAPRRTLGELEAGLHWNSRLMLGGARWQMVVVPIAAAPLLDAHRREWAVVGAGLAVTALVALYLLHLTRQRQRLEQEIRLRREAEDRVGFTNTILSAAMESSLDGILVVDQNGRIISYNRRLTEIWGIPPDLPPGAADEPVLQAVTSQVKDPERFEARVKFLYDHPEEQGQDRIETKDGRVFERFSRSLFYRDEEYLGRIWFFHDVTEREAMEEAMRQSEEKYRNLVESTTDYIWETGEDGRYTYVSPAAKPMLGYAPSELIGKTPFDIMPAAEAARVSTEFAGITRERRSFSMLENVVRRKDGNEIVLETSGVPVLDRDGSLKGYRGIDRDVTERRRIADALAYRGRLLHALATSATQLLTSPSFEEGIQNALGNIGEAMGVHRLIVMEGRRTPTGIDELAMQYGWHSAEAPTILDPSSFARVSRGVQGDPWFKPLAEGRPVMETLSHAQGPIRSLLESLDVKSILIVPVTIDGKYWGQIGVDECKSEREWTDTELDILNSLAQMIGTSMMRARYLKQLADANTIVQNSPTILYRVRGEPSLPMVYISHNITSFGYDPAELIESPQFYRSLVHPDDEEKVREAIATLMKKDSGPAVVDFRMRTADGRYRWVENRYTPVRDAGGRLSEIEGVLIDITERKQAEEKIALLARTDSLTGLANRATFVDRLHQSFAAARRGAAPFGLLYLDLDRFKDINDTLGHPIGDMLLKTVADRLKITTRESDLIARLGGDEFAVLQSSLADAADAGQLAAKIRSTLARPYLLEGNELHVTASVGISFYDPLVAGPDDLLAQADLALYRAKEEGRNQYRFHSAELDHEARERVAIAEELRLALDRDEFELYYQPQVEFSTGAIVGMEALIRWHHPTRGLLTPGTFLPVAEKTGAIMGIGQWVLDRACQQMNLWRKARIAPKSVAVNLSLAQLRAEQELVESVIATLDKWKVAPEELELDVTESMLAHTTLSQNDAIERLQKLGVNIAIDDFGTQYSSLDYLKTYSVSRLKIPQPMVDAAAHDPGSAAMVRAIVSIARELRIEVVAQGVETETQWSFLTEAAPTAKVQGYYYSAPVQAEQAAELLRAKRIVPAGQRSPALARKA